MMAQLLGPFLLVLAGLASAGCGAGAVRMLALPLLVRALPRLRSARTLPLAKQIGLNRLVAHECDCHRRFRPERNHSEFLPRYEARPQQLVMAETVSEALDNSEHAIVEAPTGVGKSFAYLVPAIQHASAEGRKVVISTGTIALQEQLVDKDIPLLQQCFPN